MVMKYLYYWGTVICFVLFVWLLRWDLLDYEGAQGTAHGILECTAGSFVVEGVGALLRLISSLVKLLLHGLKQTYGYITDEISQIVNMCYIRNRRVHDFCIMLSDLGQVSSKRLQQKWVQQIPHASVRTVMLVSEWPNNVDMFQNFWQWMAKYYWYV